MQKIVLIAIVLALAGCSKKASSVKRPSPPKLIVFICVDQFRYDYLNRFSPFFGENGFNRLLKNGAQFVNCEYDQATTHTSVGHSIMMSGVYPRNSGIIANYWYDRDLRKRVYSAEDTLSPVLGIQQKSNTSGRSPRRFTGTNLGDELRLYTQFQSKVFAVSNKDRSAIFMGGRMPNAAYWMSDQRGGFFTSAYYMNAYPAWVDAFNNERSYDRWAGKKWELLLDESQYPAIDYIESLHYDYPKGWQGTLPYTIGLNGDRPDSDYYRLLVESPFASETLLDFTERLTVEEQLGVDNFPDILCVSFSSNDYIGHSFGANSREVMDAFVRTDLYLSRLIKFMDQKLGNKNILYVLTSDHGVAPIPERLVKTGIEAGRVKPSDIEKLVDDAMIKKFGSLFHEKSYVGKMAYPDLYFNDQALAEKKIDKKTAEDYISEVLTKSALPLACVFTSDNLVHGKTASDKLSEAVIKNFHKKNSGDLLLVLKPFFLWDKDSLGTEHSLPYTYDAHVPLILCGEAWIKAGTYAQACSPADIAPTLAAILGILDPSACEGRILNEAIRFLK